VKTDAISELSFLVLVARHASLSAAARELNLTPPAVTKRLAQMEKRLGVRLLNRTTRSLSLTAEGELYVAHASRILSDIREMEEQVVSRGGAPKGLLRVNATLGFGRTTIAPLISRFAKAYPDVAVQLRLTDRPLDLVEEAFDLGIRFGALPDTRLSARKVMSNRRFLCAAPSYLKQFGEPQTLAELGAHRCILHRQNNDAPGVWRLTKGRKSESVKVGGTLSSNDGDVVLNWALDGHGILLRSEWDAKKYLDSGRLRQILKDYRPEPADLFVYYPSGRNMPVRLRAFIDFLVQGLNMDKLSE
jgi:LysR family transcriptional regulator, transcriptional activator for dmlA